ncbi:MAG TPA: tripartite tricarboxylate transporter substrate-binding protein [Usitatibacter sp.]|nr:tripartite tricarboxylate transporter substrate-binding protein [Usitatibacter sp.]
MPQTNLRRRRLMAGAAGALALSRVPFGLAAEKYPSGNMRVIIPTGKGGSADRLARTFDDFWGPLLGTHFEYQFMQGAAGQVGYETFVHKMPHDGEHLLFGNMGPEMIMYVLQNPDYRFPRDYQYFCRTDIDDSIVFASKKGKIQTLQQAIDEGKKRTLNVAVSRLPHPASIGMLALARATGARFNLVPYGGGHPTSIAVLNGECDIGALPIAGVIVQDTTLKVLGIFNDEHKMAKHTDAPSVNQVAGTKIPALPSSRSWAVHTDFIEKSPGNFAKLEKTSRQVFDDPKYLQEYARTGAPVETSAYGDRKTCTEYVNHMIELTHEYRTLLSAKKKGGS